MAEPSDIASSGESHEPLVLLPGTLCDRRVFEPLISHLHGYDIIVETLAGASSTPEAAARLLRLLPRRFALLGFSLGGIVALEMIAQAPERVTRLALLDTTPLIDPVHSQQARRAALRQARKEGLAAYARRSLLPAAVAHENAGAPDITECIVAMAAAAGLQTFSEQCEIAIHRADSRPRLARIDAPTLVLCGAQDSICRPVRHVEMAAAIPGAALAIVPEAGHFAVLERPVPVAGHVEAWLSARAHILTRQHMPESLAS